MKTRRPRGPLVHAIFASVLMFAVVALTEAMTPRVRLIDQIGRLDLEAVIPKSFADWQVDPKQRVVVVNPQQEAELSRIYSQTLTRTYVNSIGERVMLSIAYGEDQRDGLSIHYPEVCYPAQGFEVTESRRDSLSIGGGAIPVRRLVTQYGRVRTEPITYWAMIGDVPFRGGIEKKLTELKFGMRGIIPDGLLFRVSSISKESQSAFSLHDRFVGSMFSSVAADRRARYFGRIEDALR